MCPYDKAYDADHALSCVKGGFIHQRQDLFAKTMSEVHYVVATEPLLIPLAGYSSMHQQIQPKMHVSTLGSEGFGKMATVHFSIFGCLAHLLEAI